MGTHFHDVDANSDEQYELPGASCDLCIPVGDEPFRLVSDVKIENLKEALLSARHSLQYIGVELGEQMKWVCDQDKAVDSNCQLRASVEIGKIDDALDPKEVNPNV